ncbi:diacylglycerol kinase family protein [bacterium]|nr:diacylglycerol kinase family protein [bacterium]
MGVIRKFGCAFRGIAEAIRVENSFKFHFAAALAAISLGVFLRISADEWAVLFLVIALVLVAEMFNTVIELVVKMMTQERNKLARQLLDISAGAVLLSSIASVVVGVVIFGSRLYRLLFPG